ncbi:hypothetical protein GP486_000137 [Trichoglossum hirsutum]|uniref:VWFA domain-containing protein n=1 Tax=Trichoglossum hirsutum TaxID=265104 RepID=A0A9P8LJ41_9PEZI|nr:hypothetical protein GP486_000137 [Trichoglossum hirsutum]
MSAPIPIPRRRSSTAFPRTRNGLKEATVLESSFGSESQSRMSSSSFSTAIMSPSDGFSEGHGGLKVRKQRRSSKTCTNAEPVRDINDFYPPQFLSTSGGSGGLSCYSDDHKVSSKYTTPPSRIVSDSEDTPKAIPTLNRDISVGAFLKAELVNSLPAIDSSRTLFDRGTLSGNKGIARGSIELDSEGHELSSRTPDGYILVNDNAPQASRLNRRSNICLDPPPKKKIFSRVLSGLNLLGRSNSIIGIRSGNVQIKRASSVPRRQKGNEAIRSSSETKPPSFKSTSTVVSSHRRTLSEPESTSAVSPSHSEPGITSTNSVDSNAVPVTRHVEPCALATPQIAPLLQASLVVTPELESIDTEGGQSFWVAIEVAGEVAVPSFNCGVPAPIKKGLNIVLLVDLSTDMSLATFGTSRDICSSMVSLLDPYTDRLAILTSYANSSPRHKIYESHVLFPLQPANFGKVLEALDSMARPNNGLSFLDDSLDHAIEAAFDVFSGSNSPDPGKADREMPAEIYSHLFLITENPPQKIDLPATCEAVQIHLVNPSVVPWTASRDINHGWELDSDFLEGLSSTDPCLRGGLLSRLRTIIEHARLGSSAGQLKDLVIDMKPMLNYEVEAIMGETKHQKLNPGQRILVFAKLSVISRPLLRPSSATSDSQEQVAQESTCLLEQLDAILGQATTEILTVEVKYKHSLFSADTNLSISSTARLRRRAQQSLWNLQPDSRLPNSGDYQITVQRHLSHFIASNHSPFQALSALEDMFNGTATLLACPAYFERLREELRHQIWISDRSDAFQNEVSLDGNSGPLQPFGHFKANSDESNTTTRAQYLDSTAISKRLARIPSKESVDEARRIWVEMRKKARGREDVRGFSDSIPVSDENLMKIAEKALSNKRSLGADTLKSIATSRRKSGLFAPWL